LSNGVGGLRDYAQIRVNYRLAVLAHWLDCQQENPAVVREDTLQPIQFRLQYSLPWSTCHFKANPYATFC